MHGVQGYYVRYTGLECTMYRVDIFGIHCTRVVWTVYRVLLWTVYRVLLHSVQVLYVRCKLYSVHVWYVQCTLTVQL